MTAAVSGQQVISIPTISEDDLRKFHGDHSFGAPAPEALFPYLSTNESNAQQDTLRGIVPDDDLGFYSDGVKRTLTDAQVALFRHTEIHKILREQRRARERALEDAENGTLEQQASEDLQEPISAAPDSGANALGSPLTTTPASTTSHGSAVSTTKPKKSNNKRKRVNGSHDRPSIPAGASSRNKKAKWAQYVTNQADPAAYTHRRIARELDEAPSKPSASVDLMYEDEDEMEASKPTTEGSSTGRELANGRKLTSYAD